MATPRLMILTFGALALVVGAVASLALGSWWILVGVMAVHFLGSAAVIGYSYMAAGQQEDKPDPVTQARLEEEAENPPADEPPLPTPDRSG
jgi:membrane protein implicated in regulation of membrane protease activity